MSYFPLPLLGCAYPIFSLLFSTHYMGPVNDKSVVPNGLPPIKLPPPLLHFYTAPPVTTTPSNYKLSRAEQKPKITKRRTSHSAIEKRRRERMNDKIDTLKALIPSCTVQFPISVQQPIHKLSVLQAAIDYIEELHEKLRANLPENDPRLKNMPVVKK